MKRDAITDVRGIKVGHATLSGRPTGCTVVLTEEGAVGGVDVRGSAPGTRETDLLDPQNLIDRVHAVVLSGGSAFGLDTASGVMRFLEERGFGYETRVAKIPIVPAAILFDLNLGDAKIRPDAASGYAAAHVASTQPPEEGNVGAGAGATVGKLFGMERAMKGGIGTASLTVDGVTVGAIVAVNAVGDIVDPASGRIVAGARTPDGSALYGSAAAMMRGEVVHGPLPGTATTIGVVATDARLTKAHAKKIAQMAHDGLARTIVPVHTMLDGDAIFALATGASKKAGHPSLIGTIAAHVTAIAVLRAIEAARGIAGIPAACDLAARRG